MTSRRNSALSRMATVPKRAADRQAASIAHEDFGRMRVEPKKADRCTHQRRAEHRQFAGPGKVKHIEVGGDVHPAEQVGEHGKCRGGDAGQTGGQAVQTIGQIDRIARPSDDHRHKHHEQPGAKLMTRYLKNGSVVAVAGMVSPEQPGGRRGRVRAAVRSCTALPASTAPPVRVICPGRS